MSHTIWFRGVEYTQAQETADPLSASLCAGCAFDHSADGCVEAMKFGCENVVWARADHADEQTDNHTGICQEVLA